MVTRIKPVPFSFCRTFLASSAFRFILIEQLRDAVFRLSFQKFLLSTFFIIPPISVSPSSSLISSLRVWIATACKHTYDYCCTILGSSLKSFNCLSDICDPIYAALCINKSWPTMKGKHKIILLLCCHGPCEQGNEPSGTIKRGQFLE